MDSFVVRVGMLLFLSKGLKWFLESAKIASPFGKSQNAFGIFWICRTCFGLNLGCGQAGLLHSLVGMCFILLRLDLPQDLNLDNGSATVL